MNKLDLLFKSLVFAALAIPGILASRYYEWLGCPSDAFICGSTSSSPNTWAGFIRVLLLIIFAVYPARIALHFATRNRLLRSFFEKRDRPFEVRKEVLRGVVVAVFTLVAFHLLTVEKIWASPTTIFGRQYIWSTPVRRSWSDVVAVSTWCRRGGRHWYPGYELTFRDGGKINLAFNAGSIADRRAAIFSALHGRRFDFDDSEASGHCMSDFLKMARQRP